MDMTNMKRIIELAKRSNDERFLSHSKETLKRHINTKFLTTTIGALAKFETIFGHLWGHGLPDNRLTPDQAKNKQLWEIVRTEILNLGNNQLRAAMSELEQYTIRYNKMKYEFVIQKDTNVKGDSKC